MVFDKNIDLTDAYYDEERRRIKTHLDYMQERIEIEDRSLRQMFAALRTGIQSLTQKETDLENALAALDERVKALEEGSTNAAV